MSKTSSAIRKFIVTGAGTGYLPLAPGTWGSAAACAVFLAVVWGSGGQSHWINGAMLAIAAAATVACVALGRFAESAFGGKDPKRCTLDEWAGQAVALMLLPIGDAWREWLITVCAAFVCFRVFDISKPPPARQLERLPHGWGIVADDLVAGIYANIVAQLVLRLTGLLG